MKLCNFNADGDCLVCSECGYRTKNRGKAVRRNCGIRGLGDVVNQITESTGIKAVVEAVAGKDCGCQKRREKLNEWFPL